MEGILAGRGRYFAAVNFWRQNKAVAPGSSRSSRYLSPVGLCHKLAPLFIHLLAPAIRRLTILK